MPKVKIKIAQSRAIAFICFRVPAREVTKKMMNKAEAAAEHLFLIFLMKNRLTTGVNLNVTFTIRRK